MLMLYITFKRTQCVFDIKAAEDMRANSTKQNVTYVVKSGLLPGFCIFCVVKLVPDILKNRGVIEIQFAEKIFIMLSIPFFAAVAVVMAIMGIMIVTKIKTNRRLLSNYKELLVNGRGRGHPEEATTTTTSGQGQRHHHQQWRSCSSPCSYQFDNNPSPHCQVGREQQIASHLSLANTV